LLLDVTLPRLRFDPTMAGTPLAAFGAEVDEVWVEVGFGGGEHALALAAANPRAGLIACEVFENGLCSLLAKLVPEGGEATAPLPGNLRLWDGDARALLRLLPDASVSRLFLMFPDPWPKARHAKRRFVHPAIIPEVARVMRPDGEWRIATDDPTYQAWVGEVLAGQGLFAVSPPATARPAGWPATRYETKARAAGRVPRYWELVRREAEARR
jgi:tRNA (guanine-N7-)-methyltransferase